MDIDTLTEKIIGGTYRVHNALGTGFLEKVYADMLIEGAVVLEIKAVQALAAEHKVQLVNYLNATKIEHGLLINFGASVQIKHKYRTFRARGEKSRQD